MSVTHRVPPAAPGDGAAPRGEAAPPGDVTSAPRPASFALFGEVMLTGVVVALLSAGVITFLPAVAAGVAHLRRHIEGRADPVRAILSDFRSFCRGVWLVAAGFLLLLALLVLDLDIATATDLPGGPVVGVLAAAALAGVVVVALRGAGGRALEPGTSWSGAMRAAARRTTDDPVGSLLLLTAVGMCVVIVWQLLAFLVVVPGLLALAVVSVEHRYARRR